MDTGERESSGSDLDLSQENDTADESQDLNSTVELDIEGEESPRRHLYPNLHGKFESKKTVQSKQYSKIYPDLRNETHPYADVKHRRPLRSSSPSSSLRQRRDETRGSSSSSRPRTPSVPQSPQAARHRSYPQTSRTTPSNSYQLLTVILLVILVAVIVYYNWPVTGSEKQPLRTYPTHEKFIQLLKTEVGELRNKYPKQNRRTWATVLAAYKSVIGVHDPKTPAILLLSASSSSAVSTSHQLAADLAQLMHDVMNVDKSPLILDLSSLNDDPDEAKLHLDEELERQLQDSYSAAVLLNLQQLHARAALLLHSYCDNDMAPYKQAALVLTLDRAARTFDSSEDVLRDAWTHEIGEDRTGTLLSRVANNIIDVQPENN